MNIKRNVHSTALTVIPHSRWWVFKNDCFYFYLNIKSFLFFKEDVIGLVLILIMLCGFEIYNGNYPFLMLFQLTLVDVIFNIPTFPFLESDFALGGSKAYYTSVNTLDLSLEWLQGRVRRWELLFSIFYVPYSIWIIRTQNILGLGNYKSKQREQDPNFEDIDPEKKEEEEIK